VPLRVPVAVTLQESGSLNARVRGADTGVIEVEPPAVFSVSPPSVQLAVQVTVASCLEPLVTETAAVIEAGLLIVCVTVQLAFAVDVLDALQKPAVLALAAVIPAVTAPAASNPVKAA
jgi:hypothetical protein